MRFAALEGRRVAVWGYGHEGRAALDALAARLPGQPVTLLCREGEAGDRVGDAGLTVSHAGVDADLLAGFDVVIKSPGISAYLPEIAEAQERGTRFTSGTALWFGERTDARVIGVTGTKGKSTTSALLAHLSRSLGVRTALAGNIGLPLLALLDEQAELWVAELSSFQTGEAGPLAVGVITSLYVEHLDWHGSAERYVSDKLKLADVSAQLLVNGLQSGLLAGTASHAHRSLFGTPPGWHVGDDGWIRRGQLKVIDAAELPLPGAHNRRNACAALAALELAGLDATAAAPALATFRPLPHRLQRLGEQGGFDWVDDSISTTPEAALAALDSLEGQSITLIVGGHDRGLDWTGFAEVMAAATDVHVIVQGANAGRIAQALEQAGAHGFSRAAQLQHAVAGARRVTPAGGVILLSPGAPSFDQFGNYAERGRRFAELAGFEPSEVSEIEGLGVA